jgi:MFS superfamily sulfate permease-like transporter
VLKGFIVGLALTIIVGQLPKLLGIEKESGDFFEQLVSVIRHLGDTQGATLAIGVFSLAVVLVLKRVAPVVPGSLVAVIVGVVAVKVFNLDEHGVAIVGSIKSGLPSIRLPKELGRDDYLATVASAAGIMLVGFAEGLGAAKTYAARHHYDIDANRELVGLGAANLGAGLCSGMVVNGSLSKTAVNGGAGARSQLSGIFVAVMTILTLLFLTGLFEDLPEATLGAIVIAALIELVDIGSLRRLYRVYDRRLGRIYGYAARADFLAASAALAGVLIFDTLPGLFIGIAVSILLLLYRSSRPHVAELGQVPDTPLWADVDRHPENQVVDGVVVLRIESSLYFANAEAVRAAVRGYGLRTGTHAIVIDAESIASIDVTAVEMIEQLAGDLERSGVQLVLARDIGQVRDVLREAGTEGPHVEIYPDVQHAVAAVRRS